MWTGSRRSKNRERADSEVGKGTVADVSEINQNRLEAEVMLMKAKEAKPSPDVAALERRLSEVERKLDQILKAQQEKRPSAMKPWSRLASTQAGSPI